MAEHTTGSMSEIERKFLVRELPDEFRRYAGFKIRQGYLAITEGGAEARVRSDGRKCFLTVKKGQGETRAEIEMPVDPDLFASLWPLTRGRRVRKTRYRVPFGELAFEVDVYRRKLKGLVTAEIEFPDEQTSRQFQPLDWMGPEVTGDERFSNRALALDGLPEAARPALAEA